MMHQNLDYDTIKEKFKDFLTTFCVAGRRRGDKHFKYAEQLNDIANRKQLALVLELDDLVEYFESSVEDEDKTIVTEIEANTNRFTSILSDSISELLPNYRSAESMANATPLDVFIEHRLESFRIHFQNEENPPDPETHFPKELLRRYEVYIKARTGKDIKPIGIRQLKADQIGKMVTVQGTIIRATEVRPLLKVATYSCDTCSAETFQHVSGTSFMPLFTCASEHCKGNKAGGSGRLQLQTRGSKFVKFQTVKIQEQSSEVPPGHVPRTLSIHCCGENTRLTSPGDHISVTGVFLPLNRESGFASISKGLIADVFVEAHRITSISKWDDGEVGEEITENEMHKYLHGDIYEKLASSIAPEVYGHEDVKKSLLLELVGGVEKHAAGLNIRGTINICLMGDPGVAKSQLLSYVDRLAPRSQFTSGRGSSGVGLTASVMKDPLTGLMALEAGALMLADEGICCIDEFDKMNDSDRTALHEVMEQQTISIAKAGILTTLHARTSVLAAANPSYGRYNPDRSIQDNINLPAALLSRFDLLWLLQDIADQSNDLRLAKHITYVHQHLVEPPMEIKPLDMNLMRRLIIAFRKYNPTLPQSLSERLVTAYVELRTEARNSKDSTFTSPRILLAILRLASALARMRAAIEVNEEDVNEAIRLVERSRESLQPVSQRSTSRSTNKIAQISDLIKKYKQTLEKGRDTLSIKDIKSKCSLAGFNNEEVERCLEEYENLNVWQINANKTKITFI